MTLDDDIAAQLRAEARRTGEPFKQVVNRVLRTGLHSQARLKALPPFKIKARNMGLRPGYSYDNISELIDQLDQIERKTNR